MAKINYKSDFDFILSLQMKGVDGSWQYIGFPTWDWEAHLRTTSSSKSYIVYCRDGVCHNCFNDNGQIHVVCNDHKLYIGRLRIDFYAHIPNSIYPDAEQLKVTPMQLDIELVHGAGDDMSEVPIELMVPMLYESAYNEAVSSGYSGSKAEYMRLSAELPEAVETAKTIKESSKSLSQSASALEMLSSEYVAGRKAIATALTNRDYPTEETESFADMAEKITNMSYGIGPFAKIGYTEDNNAIQEMIDYSYNLAKGWDPDGSTLLMFKGNTNMQFLPLIDTSRLTSMRQMFSGCTYLSTIPLLDLSLVTDASEAFYACSALRYIPTLNASNLKNMTNMFKNSGIVSISMPYTTNVTSMTDAFFACSRLSKINILDMSSVTGLGTIFLSCNALTYCFIKNLGKSALTTYYFSGASIWGTGEAENRQSLIDSLITYSYDRASAGMATATITLSATTKALLTDDEIAQITTKGFTIA